MTKTYKAVLKSSLIMLILFAVAGSSVAQAQECFARRTSGSPNTVRAEGMTELLGGIELKCAGGMGVGFGPPATIEISIELNTMITNATTTTMMWSWASPIRILTVTDDLGDAMDLGIPINTDWTTAVGDNAVQVLSDDGMAITWAIPSSRARPSPPATVTGGTVVIEASWPTPLRWEMAKISP